MYSVENSLRIIKGLSACTSVLPVLSSETVHTIMFFWGNAFFLSPWILGVCCSALLICCCSGNRSTGSHGP